MRADRLIAVLMLLQRRESVTAAEVAAELEISTRTARRDLESLGASGVPVYSTPGRGGGWRLVGGARTDLTGLTGPEVRALFLAAGSVPGQSPEVARALAKLQRAVPAPFRDQAAQAAEAIFVDPGSGVVPEPWALAALQEAVTLGVRVELGYRDRTGRSSTRTADPLGLVAKGRVWYLVTDTEAGRRTFRVDRVSEVRLCDDPVRRPVGFDLREAWEQITAELAEVRPTATITGVASPWVLGVLRRLPWVQVAAVGPADDHGRHRIELAGGSVESLCGIVAGLAEGLEVEQPRAARELLARTGEILGRRYAGPAEPRDDVVRAGRRGNQLG